MLPNLSNWMSLSVYLRDVIVISIFEHQLRANRAAGALGNGGRA